MLSSGSEVSDEEAKLLYDVGGNSVDTEWTKKIRHLAKRKKTSKWIMRYASTLHESDIMPEVLSPADKRLKRFTDTGWTHIKVKLPPVPNAPAQVRIENIEKFNVMAQTTYLCYKCWKSVPVGVEKV